MSKSISEAKIMQAAWKKALHDGKWTTTFKTPQEAARIRFCLYNAVKKVKSGEEVDAELLEAARECTVQIQGAQLSITKRVNTDAFQTMIQSLGGEAVLEETQVAVSAEEVQIAESLALTLKKLEEAKKEEEAAAVHRPKNPYYTRED